MGSHVGTLLEVSASTEHNTDKDVCLAVSNISATVRDIMSKLGNWHENSFSPS